MGLPLDRRKIITWRSLAETMWIFAFRAPKLGWWTEVLLYLHASNRGPGIVSTDNELYSQRNYVVSLACPSVIGWAMWCNSSLASEGATPANTARRPASKSFGTARFDWESQRCF